MRSNRSLGWVLGIVILGLGFVPFLGGSAAGDEPPPADEPEAAPPTVVENEPEPPKAEPPVWGDPAAPPTADKSLPPPVIRVRSRGPRPTVATEPAIKDVPSEVRPPQRVPSSGVRRPPPAQPARTTAKKDEARPITTRSAVHSISKTHNVPLRSGDRVLKLDVEYEVVGETGRDVYVGVWFVRRDKDRYIRARMWQYADPQGFLTVQTGLGHDERRDDVFLHINDYRDPDGYTVNNEDFASLKTRQAVIEFELVEQEPGKFKAVNAVEFEEPEW